MADNLSMQVPSEIVERSVRDLITANIAEALGSPEDIVRAFVHNALSMKTNERGVVSQYRGDNKHSFLEATAGKFVREAAQEALQEFFAENKEMIKRAVKNEVASSPGKFAQLFMAGIERSMSANYHTKVDINFEAKG